MDEMGKELIEAINEAFKVTIPLTDENAKGISDVVDCVIKEHDYGYCDSCDGRRRRYA